MRTKPIKGQFDRLFVGNSMSNAIGELVKTIHREKPGTVGVVEGQMWSGKSAALRYHIGRSRKSSFTMFADPTVKGEILSVEGCLTPKALALAICRSLSPRAIDPTRATTKSAAAAALDFGSRFGGVLVLDDFDSILRAGVSEGMKEFLRSLASMIRIVVSGRDGIISRGLGQAGIPHHASTRMMGWNPAHTETHMILRNFELGMGQSIPGYFKDHDAAQRFAEVVPTGAIGAYHDLLRLAWRAMEEEGRDRLDARILDGAVVQARESNHALAELITDERSRPSRRLRPPADGSVAVKGVVEASVSDWVVGSEDRHLLPSGGCWKVPVEVPVKVEIIPRSEVRHVATVKYQGEDYRRELEVHADTHGRLYRMFETSGKGERELVDAILGASESLVGYNDEPEAMLGFPWGMKDRKSAADRVRRNVEKAIPRIASHFALTSDGWLLERVQAPFWFASASADGSFPVLDIGKQSLPDLARSFDHDDFDGILTFIDVVDKFTGHYRGEQPAFNGSVVEASPGALPRDALSRFLSGLVQNVRASLSDVVPTNDVVEALAKIAAAAPRVDKESAPSVFGDLRTVEAFLIDRGFDVECDYASNVSLLTLAQIRVAIVGGIILDPVDKTPYAREESPVPGMR